VANAVNRFGRFNVYSKEEKERGFPAAVLEDGAGPHGPLSSAEQPAFVSPLKCGELRAVGITRPRSAAVVIFQASLSDTHWKKNYILRHYMRYLVLPSVRGIIPRPDTDLCISHVQNHKDFGQI
jgi:hypothetical protein